MNQSYKCEKRDMPENLPDEWLSYNFSENYYAFIVGLEEMH